MSSLFVKKYQKIKKVRNLIGGLMWIPNGIVTNLPAGIISVVSNLNEFLKVFTGWGRGVQLDPCPPTHGFYC